jgi:hypothetical protein
MADRNKFEEMLERLVNEDRAGAEELFHEIVVEKSRDIYESLLESDLEDEDDEEVDETTDEEVDESDDEEVDESEDDEELDEDFNLDEFEVEADPMADMMGGDKTDDMMGDMKMSSDDDSDDGEEGTDERINDLEDALEELKAEFEKMMSGEEGEPEMDDDEMDMDDEEADDEMDMDDEEPEEESFQATITPLESKVAKSAGEQMREYVEKVSATMGDNGVNTTSTLAKPNNMGGTTANIAKGGTADTKGTAGGLASNKPQAMNTKNVNVVGANGATKMSSQPGHGAEKKGKPETAANTKSTIGK